MINMLQSLKASRFPLARAARPQIILHRRSLFAPTASLRADLVQDLYLRELKNYKPPPAKPSDSEGHVQKFLPPKAPQSPEETDIASELKEYEAQQVEVEGQAAEGEAAEEWSWFEEDEDEDEEGEAQSAH